MLDARPMTVRDLKKLVEELEWKNVDDRTPVSFILRNYGSPMEYSVRDEWIIRDNKVYLRECNQEGYFD